jgi:serine/threonine protein kinase
MREGDVLLGKYRVERFATESLVTTAEATHLEMGNRVQVLLLSSKCRGFVAARDHFMRVSRVLNRMQSRHVARILDAGTLDGSIPFTVSQLVGATHLGALIREQGPLSISDAVDFILQLSEGLAEAHSYGILHGSLKPANVRLISGIDGSPSVSLLGFGVPGQWTLSEGQGLPTSGRGERWPASSLPYLAPEQIRHPMDLVCRSDIWALGTILHEALAGEPPFRSDNAASLLASIVADPAAPLSNWRSDVPRSLDSVVNHCLEKDPNARFASVAEMSRALQPFASPDTQNLVERIARVVARQGRASLSVSRSSKAVIHLRGEEAHTSRDRRPKSEPSGTTYAAHRAVRPQPRSNWLLMMGALLGVGVASGVGGAVVAAKLVAPKPALAQDAAAPSLASAVQIYAAMPTAASSGAAGPPKEAGSVPVAAPVPPERAVAARVHRNRDVMGKTKVEPQRPESVEPDTVMAEPSSRPIVASGQLFDDIQ